MLLLLCFLSLGCTLSAQEPERETAKEARIFRLPEFERAFLCVRYFEGWHSEKNHPYVGWEHCLQPGEKYSARTMTRQQADELLRKDLRKFCAMFRQLTGTFAGAKYFWQYTGYIKSVFIYYSVEFFCHGTII